MTCPLPLCRRARLHFLAIAAPAALLAHAPLVFATPGGIADALARLGEHRAVTRSVSLDALGMHEPLVLPAPDTRHELYLPVPAGVPLDAATLQLDGAYLHADGGRTTMLVSLDGAPVLARGFTLTQGDAATSIGVDGTARPGGFVRVGLQWSSVIDERLCTDQTAIGNVLRIAPSTRLTYRFDPAAITDVRTAWSALPVAPVVAIAAPRVAPAAFDAAWRIGTLAEREGRRPVVRTWPAVGDTVDLTGMDVPAALRAVPAFAALAAGGTGGSKSSGGSGLPASAAAGGPGALNGPNAGPNAAAVADASSAAGQADASASNARQSPAASAAGATRGGVKLADAAQLGALLALAPRAAFAPDVIVADDTLRRATRDALNALRTQVAAASPPSAAAFDAWRERTFGPIERPLAAGEVRIAHLAGQTAIVVGDNAGVAALARAWRPIGVAQRYVAHRLDDTPYAHAERISLAALGGEPRTLDVLGRAMWEASFELAALAGDGKLPDQVVLDVAAAPTPRAEGEIASIYLNGVLIASQLLTQNGKPERIAAHIPRYALAPTNALRVVFQRRLDGGCEARSQGYPVAVLPTSHVTLANAHPDDDFTGLLARFSHAAEVIVPAAYLDDAPASLARLARLASIAGLAPTRATLSVAANGTAAAPSGPFLAADVALPHETSRAALSKNRLTLTDPAGRVYADVSDLRHLAVIQVAQSGSTPGIVYRSLDAAPPQLPAALRLSRGDVALVSSNGVASLFDSRHPGEPVSDRDTGVRRAARGLPWLIAAGAVAALAVLLAAAAIARRRHRNRSGA
ncbi:MULTISPECIES: cellulose biosynthesis cyclic di-GMP-binding regulatory protein BcsB [Burkholderia]|uniref:cellulose biosynthesis cyclic di-GMP-binding regulatory protein BcsB n=1 Tax=Burkholderia TaxID=32008 RepID=UPI0011AFB0F0|nr:MULTISPECIES: cellulose biosynthesis cyclic di-GMP-binding regulatory protein BcsB [unclassified Burkholderia]